MPTITRSKQSLPESRLVKESRQREAFINRIKQEVAQPVDNIKHPVPLFNQLQK